MFEKEKILEKIKKIDVQLNQQETWNNHILSNELLKKKNDLKKFFDSLEYSYTKFNDVKELMKLAEVESELGLLEDLESELLFIYNDLNLLYVETLMKGKADSKNCFLEIHAGAGGTESQDWVSMLLRMYTRWAESKKASIELIEQTEGEEIGLKSVTAKIIGEKKYGWLKYETGVHRLVRISPFDSQSRRHTSFASVSCYPEVDNSIKIEISEKDLRIDTYRASGAGGQHVNKTDSAVRITHLPSKISVQCQTNRSQHRNKSIAMEMLKSKLYEIELKKEVEENLKERGIKTDIGWGHQIRSYVMQPYQMVKDHRTRVENSNVNAILDGKIDEFLKSSLLKIS